MYPKYYLVLVFTVALITLFYEDLLYSLFNAMRASEVFRNQKMYFRSFYNLNINKNLPNFYLTEDLKFPESFNKTCAQFPEFFDLQFEGHYWQVQKTSKGTFHLFNSYLDLRNGSFVQILGLLDVYKTEDKFYCQFWYNDGTKPKIVESKVPIWIFYQGWVSRTRYYHHPYLVSCPLPSPTNKFPVSVSLVEKLCDNATNNLKIFHKKQTPKKDFVVCVKGLSYPSEDISYRLIEWIELLQILGATKINFYEFNVHPNIQKVLDYYVAKKTIEVTPITSIGDSSSMIEKGKVSKDAMTKRLQELVPYNDCLYKHLDQFQYVVLLDVDEVVIPEQKNWRELIKTLEKNFPGVNSFLARNVYFLDYYMHNHEFFDGIPKNMHMLQHVYRAKNFSRRGYYVKGFHNTQKVLTLHNHYPFKCLGDCTIRDLSTEIGQLQHYRKDCLPRLQKDCSSLKENSVLDTKIWKYKEELINKTRNVCEDLKLHLE